MDLQQLKANMIFNLLERIENKTKVMAHEDKRIKKELRRWQDGQLNSSYFINILNKYLDDLNK